MPRPIKYLLLFLLFAFASFTKVFSQTGSNIDYVKLSEHFLYAAKTGEGTSFYVDSLKNLDAQNLASELNTDDKRKAFWLNLYNAYTQVFLKKNPDQYKTRNSFFSKKQIDVAKHEISLDEIEHGILRHSKIKWSEGYLGKLFPSSFEKKFRVEKLDNRIHFALNCGAKSCPPIAFYDPQKIDRQLNMAEKTYLKGESTYDSTQNMVNVPALMGWFRGDFGGKKGIRKILEKNNIIPQNSDPKIHFNKYDWTLYLNNFKQENNG